MSAKRIIAAEKFNLIEGCYFSDFVEHGHKPVSLMAKSYRQIDNVKKKVPVKIDDSVKHVLICHGGYFVTKYSRSVESSPNIALIYKDEKSWDDGITQIRAAWGNSTVVFKLTTQNRENGMVVCWIRQPTENGLRNSRLILDSISGDSFENCKYTIQQKAAGELWEDTCEYDLSQFTSYRPMCQIGSH